MKLIQGLVRFQFVADDDAPPELVEVRAIGMLQDMLNNPTVLFANMELTGNDAPPGGPPPGEPGPLGQTGRRGPVGHVGPIGAGRPPVPAGDPAAMAYWRRVLNESLGAPPGGDQRADDIFSRPAPTVDDIRTELLRTSFRVPPAGQEGNIEAYQPRTINANGGRYDGYGESALTQLIRDGRVSTRTAMDLVGGVQPRLQPVRNDYPIVAVNPTAEIEDAISGGMIVYDEVMDMPPLEAVIPSVNSVVGAPSVNVMITPRTERPDDAFFDQALGEPFELPPSTMNVNPAGVQLYPPEPAPTEESSG